jgi:hypothetical protein
MYGERRDNWLYHAPVYDGSMGHLMATDCLRMITSEGVSLVEIISLALDCTQLCN